MQNAPFPILIEDNHLLAIVKPSGLPTMGVAEDKPSVLRIAKKYIKQRYNKPGEVYLGFVSRLDAPVSGVLLIARTSKAAARLNTQFRTARVEKDYWGLVEGMMQPTTGQLTDWLRKDERHRRVHVGTENNPETKKAELTYRSLGQIGRHTLLQIRLITGRKHQIRVQLAHAGYPIVGDRKYGSRVTFPSGIALHSRRLRFMHPVKKEPVDLTAPLPAAWQKMGVEESRYEELE